MPKDIRVTVAKAKAMLKASDKLAAEFLAEKRSQEASKVYECFSRLPVSSLARLFDIIKKTEA